MKNALLFLTLLGISMVVEAQEVRRIDTLLCLKNGHLVQGVVPGERTPEARYHCRPRGQGDSVNISVMLYDPQSDEALPYTTVFAIHKEGARYVVDSMVPQEYMYQFNFRTPASAYCLFSLQTVGYTPVILEYDPTGKQEEVVLQFYTMQDEIVSKEEFESARSMSAQFNSPRRDREPDRMDSLIIRKLEKDMMIPPDLEDRDEHFFEYGEGLKGIDFYVAGSCVTRLQDDTVDMEGCFFEVSAQGQMFGGFDVVDWGEYSYEPLSCVYIYSLTADGKHVDKEYRYRTSPMWVPSGMSYFWGDDGWLYFEAYASAAAYLNRVSSTEPFVYHRVHL